MAARRKPTEPTVTVRSVNVPGYQRLVKAAKSGVTTTVLMRILPRSGAGLTQTATWDAVGASSLEDCFRAGPCRMVGEMRAVRPGSAECGGARQGGEAAALVAGGRTDRGIRDDFSDHRVVVGGGLGR